MVQALQFNDALRPLRLATLINLRWLAIVGQTVSVMIVALAFKFPLPLLSCLIVIGMSVVLNVWMALQLRAGQRLTDRLASLQLGFDCLQLGALLWLTGGLENPFSLLLLAPVSVSATTMRQSSTMWLAILVCGIASILAIWHLPLPWQPLKPLEFDTLYLAGVWVSILLGVAFIATYTNRVAHEARQLADALTATELTLSRQQQLSALDGLAAAAAHELGTPLSTIALAAKEMRTDIAGGPAAEDLELIIAQAARCRAILAKLRNLDEGGNDPFDMISLIDLVREVAKPLEAADKIIRISVDGATTQPTMVRRNVGLMFGLGNIIENAVRFARGSVEVEVYWQGKEMRITVTDDGPGFPPDLLAHLGEPYLNGHHRYDTNQDGETGLGLGVFIAKTLLERTGARLRFANRRASGHAVVEIYWPLGLETEN